MRPVLDDRRRELARRIRRDRPGPRWPRPVGFLMLALAGVAAIEGEWSLPRSVPDNVSDRPDDPLVPRLVAPIGNVSGESIRFAWSWDGPPTGFDLVLLDEELREFCRHRVAGTEFSPDAALAERLRDGSQHHWFVAAQRADGEVRTAPAAFTARR